MRYNATSTYLVPTAYAKLVCPLLYVDVNNPSNVSLISYCVVSGNNLALVGSVGLVRKCMSLEVNDCVLLAFRRLHGLSVGRLVDTGAILLSAVASHEAVYALRPAKDDGFTSEEEEGEKGD